MLDFPNVWLVRRDPGSGLSERLRNRTRDVEVDLRTDEQKSVGCRACRPGALREARYRLAKAARTRPVQYAAYIGWVIALGPSVHFARSVSNVRLKTTSSWVTRRDATA